MGHYRLLALILLPLCIAAWAQPDLPDGQNRETLETLLQVRGIPYQTISSSLVVTPPGGGGSFILVVPLAYTGESPLDAEALPLRFSAALSLIETLQAGDGEGGARMIIFPGKLPGGLEQGAELERALEGLEDPADAVLWYINIPAGADAAIIDFEGSPSLDSIRPIPPLCDELDLDWSFDIPLFPLTGQFAGQRGDFRTLSRLAESDQFGQMNLMLLRPKNSPPVAAAAAAAAAGDGETLGAFFYRYARSTGGELRREHNYLVVQAAGKVFFISELRLALSFLIITSFFIFGMLFLPRFPLHFLRRSPIPPGKGEFARERVFHVVAVVMLWFCLICTAAAVLFRISVYPFLAPALILSFAARSLRRPLLSGILLAGAAAWLGLLLGLAVLPG